LRKAEKKMKKSEKTEYRRQKGKNGEKRVFFDRIT
jgi:hypothetical protein